MTAEAQMTRAAHAMAAEWAALVRAAAEIPHERDAIKSAAVVMARLARSGAQSIERKIRAVHHALGAGLTTVDVIRAGQEQTLGGFQRSRRDGDLEKQVSMSFKVPGTTRELVQQQIDRICKVLQMPHDMWWTWWIAQMMASTDDDIRHSAGEAVHAQEQERPTEPPEA